MKRKLYFLTGVILLLIIYLIGIPYYDSLIKNDYELFNKSNIKGLISSIDTKRRGIRIKIGKSSSSFVFYPITDKQLNDSHIFNYFAEPGDSINKPAYSDTLFLFKNERVYRYTFQKP